MKPFQHAKNSARKYWGKPEDYQAIHDFFGSDSRITATRDGFDVEEGFDHD